MNGVGVNGAGVSDAPLYAALAEGPPDGRAVWLTAADGVRIRAAVWAAGATQGTVFLFPGRTEYIEKYGRSAAVLAEAGYATLTVDWRGQGLADRPGKDRMVGHVEDFAEYQADFAALLAFANAQGLPEPYYLLAHSMGGCIALRSLMNGAPVQAAAISAPMWGILMADWMRPFANILSTSSRWLAFDHRYAPGTNSRSYVVDVPFVGNMLTTDAEMWDYMRQQALAHPELVLGGPSLGWLKAALDECAALAALPSPAFPVVCALGNQERIVDVRPVHARMAQWPGGRLDLYAGAEHEVLMERPATRAAFLASAVALFQANR